MKTNLYLIITILLLVIYSIFSTQSCNRWKEQYNDFKQNPDTTYIDTSNNFEVKPEISYIDTGSIKWKPYPVYRDTGSIDTVKAVDTVFVPVPLSVYTQNFKDSIIEIDVTAKVYGDLDSLFVDYTTHIPVIQRFVETKVPADGVYVGPEVLYQGSLLYGLGAEYVTKNGWGIEGAWYPTSKKDLVRFGIKKKIW